MDYKRILTIQDISCVGQCSLTVALPILSACGQETCILPSAVLSTHTMGYSFPSIRDLTPDIPGFQKHWQKENILFDAIYTGYLGSTEQVAYVADILQTMTVPGGKTIVDPAMADHGKLYPAFDAAYVEAMKGLVSKADVVVPNLTEACFLTGCTYQEEYDQAYITQVVAKLHELGTKWVVLTGIGYEPGMTGILISGEGTTDYYAHPRIPKNYHGTGDIYASAFVGSWVSGKTMGEAIRIAADYTYKCIENTLDDDSHWYGVKFETAFPYLIEKLYC